MGMYMLRAGEAKDAPRMAEMEKEIFPTPWSEESLLYDLSQNPNGAYIVAEVGGVVVGYAGVRVVLDEADITNVAVDERYRRLGIGRAMLTELLAVCEDIGANNITLEVRVSNEAAIALYESLGFKQEGLRKEYYQDNKEDAIIMWRRKSPESDS